MFEYHISWPRFLHVLKADLTSKKFHVGNIEKLLQGTTDPERKELLAQMLEYRLGQVQIAQTMIRKAMESWDNWKAAEK